MPSGAGGSRRQGHLQRQPREAGVPEPGSRQQVSWGRPPATPGPTSYAFKFRPAPLSLQSPRRSRSRNKNGRRWSGALKGAQVGEASSPRPPATSRELAQTAPAETSPVTARPQGPSPGRRRRGLELPSAQARCGLLPLQPPKCPPHLFTYAQPEFPIQLCQAVTSPPSRPTLSGQTAGETTLHSG